MRIDTVNIHFGSASPLIAGALLAALGAGSISGAQPPKQATSAASKFALPKVGEYWAGQGGIYVGVARGFDARGDAHLIFATDPASKLESRSLGTYGVDVGGATSDHDGLANTIALAEAGSELCKEIRAIEIDGHSDFGLMSRREAALCWANVPEQFEKEWHLTSTQASSHDAWIQSFDNGTQYSQQQEVRGPRSPRPQIVPLIL